MKTLFKVLFGLVAILAVVLIVGILNLDKGIKAAVETVGPELTQSSVKLNDVDLSLKTGEGSLSGLSVGNPQGFTSADAFNLGKITLAVDTESITTDTIIIKTLHIISPKITYEQGKNGSNLQQLQRNVEKALGSSSSGQASTSEESAKKLIIKDFALTGGEISYSNPLLGNKNLSLALPDIKLTGIGEKTNGATAAEAVNQILAAINKNALSSIKGSDVLKNLQSDAIEQGKSKIEDALGGFKGLLKKD